jgi:hypothetical protein
VLKMRGSGVRGSGEEECFFWCGMWHIQEAGSVKN